MPFLVLLVLGLLIWRYAHQSIQKKGQDHLMLEARVCVLEREARLLREALENREDRFHRSGVSRIRAHS
jgi:hypothetical protein